MRVLLKLHLPQREKAVRLPTTQEIVNFLNNPMRNTIKKVFFCPNKAQGGLDEKQSRRVLHIIGKVHSRGKGWDPCASSYYDHVLDLIRKGKIQNPKNLIAYTLGCHKPITLGKFMDKQHDKRIKHRKLG